MQIKSKGILSGTRVSQSLIANDWPLVQLVEAVDIRATGNLSANGLIIRNINVQDSALTGLTSANTVLADSVTSNVWNRLYTANVVETSGNLYFTQSRARSSFTAGNNIEITPEGVISAQTQAIVANDSETLTAAANTLAYALARSVTNPKSILIVIEGLLQIPTTDYTTDGYTLTFTSQPPVGAKIEVRYFGIDSASSYSSTFLATINNFVGDGSNTTYSLNSTPAGIAYSSVVIDGVTQLSSAYTIVSNSVQFTEAPPVGANIEIRVFSGAVGASFNTRTFVGDGVANTYNVTSGYNDQNILIFKNGIALVPTVDYTVDANSTVRFVIPPALNANVQIRELGTGTANLVNQITGSDIRTGNLQPKVDGAQNIGTANLRYNKIYLAGANSLVLGNTTVSISGATLTLTTAGTTTAVGGSTDTPHPFLLSLL